MAKKQKYYVVWKGASPGIYNTWEECKLQIQGFPGALYKSFKSKIEAEEAFKGNYYDFEEHKSKAPLVEKMNLPIDKNALSVDAACSGNPGKMEYQGVWVSDKVQLFHIGPLDGGTNNVGEFLALVHALALLEKQGRHDIPIYSDSKIAMGWVRKKKCNTKLTKTSKNAIIFQLIDRAEKWLKTHPVKNKLLKWETKSWGEIPADFGRK